MFHLAWNMGCTVKELEQRLDCRERVEWYVYHITNPWGDFSHEGMSVFKWKRKREIEQIQSARKKAMGADKLPGFSPRRTL